MIPQMAYKNEEVIDLPVPECPVIDEVVCMSAIVCVGKRYPVF